LERHSFFNIKAYRAIISAYLKTSTPENGHDYLFECEAVNRSASIEKLRISHVDMLKLLIIEFNWA